MRSRPALLHRDAFGQVPALLLQKLPQCGMIFYDTVMDQRQLPTAAGMRMGIDINGSALADPAETWAL